MVGFTVQGSRFRVQGVVSDYGFEFCVFWDCGVLDRASLGFRPLGFLP